MSGLELKGLEELLEAKLRGTTLGDKKLGPVLFETEVDKELPIELDEMTFTIKGDATVLLFNSKDDTAQEKDGIIGKILPDGGTRTWLKYNVGVSAKADGGVSSKGVGFSFSAEANARVMQYRAHDPGTNAADAVVDDLQNPRLALVPSHLAELRDGDAVVLQVGGSLALGVEASWSYIYNHAIGALTSLLAAGQVLSLDAKLGASASFDVTVKDSFLLRVVRKDDALQLTVKKSKARSGELGLKAGISVKFHDEAAAEAITSAALDAVVGTPVDEFLATIQDRTYGELDDDVRAQVDAVVARLDIGTAVDPLVVVRVAIDDARKRAGEIIKRIAKAKLEAGFAYDYARVSSESAVLEATLTPAAAQEHHGALIRGRLDRILALAVAGDSGVSLVSFVTSKTSRVTRSYGFGLSLGDFGASGSDTIDRSTVVDNRRDASNVEQIRVALTNVRGYRAKWFGNEWSYRTEWQATMPAYADRAYARDLEYGVAVTFERVERHVSSGELTQYLDLAEIWGILPPEQLPSARKRIEAALKDATDVRLGCEIKLDHVAVVGVLAELARRDGQRVAHALARAMAWSDKSPIQRDPEKRDLVYAPLWLAYLTKPHMKPNDLAEAAYRKLRWKHPNLAARERDGANGSGDENTIGGLAQLNRSVRRCWADLSEGATELTSAIQGGGDYKVVQKALNKMRRAGEQKHWSRTFGAYLYDILESRPLLLTGSARTGAISFKLGHDDQTLTLSSSVAPVDG